MRRVKVQYVGDLPDALLLQRLSAAEQVLCVVNTTKHAARLGTALAGEGTYHLSARMCPVHRSEVLAVIRARLAGGLPCRVVSTQVIECGVDIDFPVVYRAMCGLDSLAQSAGRCNREGALGTR
jgi:CRISPR-associated endonuclease/helicase Cas3